MKRFYLCNNPDEELPPGVLTYIYGAVKPRFFATLTKLDGSIPLASIAYVGITVLFYFRAPGDEQVYPYALRVTDNIDQEVHHDMISILQHVAEWYAYHQSAQASAKHMEFGLLKEFSEQLNGFQILEDEKTGSYLLNFALGAHGFDSLDAALKFLEVHLNIDKAIVYGPDRAINR